ncbi:tetratricopeptide repeat protein [Dactylosporangium sp. AC04546]|uniref:tetratricopeptide repeat protein n=1 Tax=Dactylosporangium sp. AC04546 TaxID=2862460 RepID=UPI001EE0F818|nr:tetratricopeptide repeat protein [Dactylosporangium sp. AC04546]WVK87351.1 tetratricopeptide repeat protein [Dactylosporangium sp. AC04546]
MATDQGGEFGAVLRGHRLAAGLSQRDLAARVGASVAAIRDLEQGRSRRPQPRSVDALVTALQLSGDGEAAFRRAALGAAPAEHSSAAGPEGPVRLGILGPLTVHRGAQPVAVGRSARRALLGRLALSANTAVPVAELVDVLWDGRPPVNAAHALHTHLSRLRSALPPAGPHRTAGGYQLDLADDQLDLGEFRRAVRGAAAVPPHRALDLLGWAAGRWRGRPLEDIPQLRDHPLVTAVIEERIGMTLRYADLALAAGQALRCLPTLRDLAADHPLHELLHARLVTVLAAEGRQADALSAYARIRQRLVDDLGVEPGPELTAAHRRVLRQETVVPAQPHPERAEPAPAQLPADLRAFAGRADAVAALDRLAADPDAQASAVLVVSGTAGVGKTTLAVHWAHRVRARFPDGQLYVNLRGFHPTGAAVSGPEALHGFLTALGLPPAGIPADADARSALYRTLLTGRRMLVLLDNARDAEQVRALLPAAPGCLALVTSRHRLTGLVAAEGALPVPLDLLTHDEARALLTRRLGAERTAAEPGAVDTIVERCARLPLALAIAAARAATRPGLPLAHLAADLAADPLSGGEPGTDVRAVFDSSYRQLTPAAARLFRLLGLHPGPDLGTAALARLAGLGPSRVAPLLAELTGAHLLAEPAAGRYAMHDLLQAYAAERGREKDSRPTRAAALGRLFEHFVSTATGAVGTALPGETAGDGFDDPAAARAWLDRERANMVALAGHGRPGDTISLAGAMHRYLDSGHYADALIVHTRALDAARQQGIPAAEAQALNHLGIAYRRVGRFADAAGLHQRALELCRAEGDTAAEGRTLELLGVAAWRLGDYDSARTHHHAALDLFRAIGDRLGEATQLNNVSIGNRQFGDVRAAIDGHRRALALLRDLGHRLGESHSLDNLGLAHQHAGEYREAVGCHEQALAICADIGFHAGQAAALNSLGHALVALGRPVEAIGHHRRALAMFREIGERANEVEAVNGLAAALLAAGDPAAARDWYTVAVTLAERTGNRLEQAAAHDGLARAHHTAGDLAAAGRHWRQSLELYAGLGVPDTERITEHLRCLAGHPA